MDYRLLKDLEIGHQRGRVICRVVRIWNATNPYRNNELMYLEFLLLDEQNTAIEASVRKQDAPRIREVLSEGKVYTLTNFIVSSAKHKFRVCNHENMIRVGTWTTIRELTECIPPIPVHYFDIVDEDTIESRLNNDFQLTDIIAQIISVRRLGSVFVGGKATPKKDLIIKWSKGEKTKITLWGNLAETFVNDQADDFADEEYPVVIFTSLTVKAYQGVTTFSSTSATRAYPKIDIPQIINFKERFTATKDTIEIHEPLQFTDTISDDITNNKKSIIELLHLNRLSDSGKKFCCDATIKEIDSSSTWWYNSCPKCTVGVSSYSGVLTCGKCGPITNLPIPWYKLEFIMCDDTGEAKFLLFGKQAERLIKIPASQLLNLPTVSNIDVPAVMTDLYGQRYRFVVSINERDSEATTLTFTVSSIIIPETKQQGDFDKANEEDSQTTDVPSDANTQLTILSHSKRSLVQNQNTDKANGKKPRKSNGSN